MIRRTVKFQLVAFALISLLGIFYVGTNYVGIHFLSRSSSTCRRAAASSPTPR